MFKKLDEIKKRYEFLSQQLADTAVIADMGTWQKYSKEQAELTETAEKYEEYLKTEKEMKDAFDSAEIETDGEMKKLLLDEGYDCKERLAEIKDELKILLLPKDKNDERSCILEVRAGTVVRRRLYSPQSFAVCIKTIVRRTVCGWRRWISMPPSWAV